MNDDERLNAMLDTHPCYNECAHRKFARMHIPIAPGATYSATTATGGMIVRTSPGLASRRRSSRRRRRWRRSATS